MNKNNLLDYQKKLYEMLDKEDKIIVKKFKNSGVAFTITLFLYNKIINSDGINIGIFSNNIEIFDFLKKFDELNLLDFKKESIQCVKNGSKIFLRKLQTPLFKGLAFDYLFIDEIASFKEAENFWKCIFPCVKNKCFIASLVNRKENNWFYNTYNDSLNNKNSFKVFECNYKDHPFYQKFDINSIDDDFILKQEILGEFYT